MPVRSPISVVLLLAGSRSLGRLLVPLPDTLVAFAFAEINGPVMSFTRIRYMSRHLLKGSEEGKAVSNRRLC